MVASYDNLDREDRSRIDAVMKPLHRGGKVNLTDVFKYPRIIDVVSKDHVILTGSQPQELMFAAPFYSSIMLMLCPGCPPVNQPDFLTPFLRAGFLIPVLIAPYKDYDPAFLSHLTKFMHMSFWEYMSFRSARLRNHAENWICGQCVDKIYEQCMEVVKRRTRLIGIKEEVEQVFRALTPAILPDFEILNRLTSSLKRLDTHTVEQLVGLSYSVAEIRTAQAFNAILSISEEKLEILSGLQIVGTNLKTSAVVGSEDFILEGLGLSIKPDMNPDEYLKIIMEHRDSLKSALHHIVADGRIEGATLGGVMERIAIVNEQIEHASRSHRQKILTATLGLIRSNEALVASLLAAGALGLAGSLFGCGVSLAAGFGTKALKKR